MVSPRQQFATVLTAAITAGAGLLADGYDLFVIDIVIAIIAEKHAEQMQPHHLSFIVAMTYAGIILGQLSTGCALDLLSHTFVSIATAALSALGCVGAACCTPHARLAIGYQLGICRFVLGLGIGGEFPVSQVISVEASDCGGHSSRGRLLAVNPVLFCTGMQLAPMLLLALDTAGVPLGVMWRVGLACGALPSSVALCLRARVYAAQLASPVALRSERRASGGKEFLAGILSHWWLLLGCCLQWGLHNMVFFGLGSFKSLIHERMFGTDGAGASAKIRDDLYFALSSGSFVFLMSLATLAVIDRCAHHHISSVAFFWMAVLLWCCGNAVASPSASSWWLLFLYFGYSIASQPGGCISYITPALVFPPEVRATCCGVAAAAGKTGAMIGAALFPVTEHAYGLAVCLHAAGLAALAASGVAIVFFSRQKGDGLFEPVAGADGL